MKVLVADGHAAVRKGIIAMLSDHHSDMMAMETDHAFGASKIVQGNPDIGLAFYDLDMPGVQKFESLSRLRASMVLRSPLVAVSAMARPDEIERALAAGASGVLLKSCGPSEFGRAVEAMLSGRTYVPSAPASDIGAPKGADRARPIADRASLEFDLTLRQRQILELLAEGLSNKEVARRLGIREGTVRIHIGSLLHKLGVKNRTQAARIAIEQKIEQRDPKGVGVTPARRLRPAHANVFLLDVPKRTSAR